MKQLFTCLLIAVTIVSAHTQSCDRLSQIIESGNQNTGGLGKDFTGTKGNDGLLYFRGSKDGATLSVWSTDGTEGGTRKIAEDESAWADSWEQILFSETASFIFSDDQWYELPHGEKELALLADFPSVEYTELVQAPDGWYYFTGKEGAGFESMRYNPDTKEIINLGKVHGFTIEVNTIAGSEAALFYNPTRPVPNIYLTATNEVLSLEDYLNSIGIVTSSATGGYLHEEFLYAAYKDSDNFPAYAMINMRTMESKVVNYFGDPEQAYTYGDYIIFVSSRRVVKVHKGDLSAETLYEDIYPWFTSTIMDESTLLITGKSEDSSHIASIDLESNEVTVLPNSFIGYIFIYSKFLIHQDEFYFISEVEGNQLLNKYDFEAGDTNVLDTLSHDTGAPISHALESVEGKLVSSKRYEVNQHELYQCDTKTSGIEILSLSAMDLTLSSQDNGTVAIQWTDANENNMDKYLVQRSDNASVWQNLTEVKYNDSPDYYTYTDEQPLNGINYYRIQQVDENGAVDYSEIRSIRISKDKNGLLYPNPISEGEVYINSEKEFYACTIMSSTGKVVSENKLQGSPQRFSVAELVPGIYYCKLLSDDSEELMRLSVVR